ncbi:MAG: glycosyltransferase family 39 protein [Solirubrobacterales bacterium]
MRVTPRSAVLDFASSHALALVVGLAALIRFATLGPQSLWYDEAVTVTETHGSLGAMFHGVHAVEGSPPLYFIVLWGWQKVVGGGDIAVRSFSALIGTATVPVVYAAARELASRRAAVVAAALAATSPLLIWYSQEVRPYPLLVFWAALSFMFFVYALKRHEPRWLVAWALACAAMLATHYFAVALIVPEAAWLVFRFRAARGRAMLALAAVAAVGLALLPLWSDQQGRGGWIGFLPQSNRILAVPQHFVVGLSVPWKMLGPLVAFLVVVAVVVALVRSDSGSRRPFWLAGGVGLAGAALVLLAVLFGSDFVITRNLLELWLPFGVAVAVALAAPGARGFGPGVAVALCALGLGLSVWNATTPAARRIGWDAVARAIGPPSGERVIATPGIYEGVPLSLYLNDAHVAKPGESPTASELVLVSLRPVRNYGIGPCFWGADCGGNAFGGSGPPFGPPPDFRLVRQGATARATYRVYRAPRPTALPAAGSGQRNIVVQGAG